MIPESACQEELLPLYLYRELTAADSRALEDHLAGCADCRAALAELEHALARVPRPELRLSRSRKLQFAEQVLARSRQRALTPRRVWGGTLAAAGTLAVALILLHPVATRVPPIPAASAQADLEILEQLELLQNLDLLQDLDLLQEMERLG